MSSRASPIETSAKKAPEVGEFGDLLKGRIDILEYLQTEVGESPSPSLLSMIPPPSAVLHHQPRQTNAHSSSLSTPLTVEAKGRPMDARHHFGARLPDSPPETDSAAGSAGSPSSASENSPCSPEFQHPGKAKGAVGPQSVIRHPPGLHPNGGGVILDPTLAQLAQQSELMMAAQHQRLQGFAIPTSGGEQFYPPPQPTPGSLAPQVSPPGVGGSQCPTPAAPYLLPASVDYGVVDGGASRKRMRPDSAGLKHSPRTSIDEAMYGDMDGYQQACIRFSEFQKESWNPLCDQTGRELSPLGFHVVADKGFNFSTFDGTFVNQKKNHFQISVHIEAHDPCPPKLVRVGADLKGIREFRLDFYGVKAEMTSSSVMIKQSQTDRKPVPYAPVPLDLPASRVTKVTVARLHFSETTMNNQRKNGRPNPDQKFFQLAVSLNAKLTNGEEVMICAHASEKVIVRASNPGQFDNGESDVPWQKGSQNGSIYHMGPVGVGTDRTDPHAALTVGGNLTVTGQLLHPSDRKFKRNIEEVDYQSALSRLSQIKIVQYEIRPEIAEKWGLTEDERNRVGVIAQELEKIIPDAVREVEDSEGDEFLQVDDSRIFYESAAAVKELCRLTGNLECKIDEVERISRKLSKISKLKRLDSMRSNTSLNSKDSSGIASSYMSSSRSTLPTPRRSHRHCNHYCTRQAEGICSNKLIQSTIIVLVIIMAFCLIAMASLYILDWHKRNNYPHGAHGPHVKNPDGTTGYGNATSRPDHAGGIPPGEMFIPRDDNSGQGRRVDWQPEWPGGTPPPALQPCLSLDCEEFCCPNVFSYVGQGKTEEVYHLQLLPDAAATPAARVGEDFAAVQAAVEGGKSRARRAILEKDAQGKAEEKKAETPASEQLGSARISVVGQNLTLDSRYCLAKSCSRLRRNFTLYIPISSAMPLIPLSVRFDVEAPQAVLSYCGPDYAGPDSLCPGAAPNFDSLHGPPDQDDPQAVREKHTNIYELPVGMFMGSAYKFRLGTSPSQCYSGADGDSFEEYTLVFYRTCRIP